MPLTMTPKELATEMRVDKSTVSRWARTGVIPDDAVIRVGGTLRFNREKIEKALGLAHA